MPLTRSWCLFECLQTLILVSERRSDHDNFKRLKLCTDRGTIGQVSDTSSFDIALALGKRLATLNVADASASSDTDQQMICGLIEEHGGMDTMNAFIRTNMAV